MPPLAAGGIKPRVKRFLRTMAVFSQESRNTLASSFFKLPAVSLEIQADGQSLAGGLVGRRWLGDTVNSLQMEGGSWVSSNEIFIFPSGESLQGFTFLHYFPNVSCVCVCVWGRLGGWIYSYHTLD